MRLHYVIAVVLLASNLAGCEAIDSLNNVKKINEENENLKFRVSELEKEIGILKQQDFLLSIQIDSMYSKTAFVSPTSEGYSLAKTDYGSITVSCNNIEKYSNGSKVKLTFGNILSATLTDVSVSIQYGPKRKDNEDYSEWNKKLKTKEFKMNDNIPAGSWTSVQAALPDYAPEDIGYMSVAVDPKGITLRKVGQ